MSSMEVANVEEEAEFKSRGYQDEIFKKCVEKNTIIYLPTGAGKTYIAIMAMKHFAGDLQKPIAEGGKRSLFLTNTKALANQQAEYIQKLTPLRVAVYTGDLNVDAWKKDKWYSEFDQHQVITATVQIVLDVVRHGYLKLSNFNLIVFDECHNAQGEHPMSHLMAKFADVPESDHPRVIGLSGSLTSSSVKPQNVLKELKDLEAKFRASIVTVQGLNAYEDVLMHSTKPNESVIQFEQYSHTAFINFIINQAGGLKNMISTWPIINTRNTADETLKRVPTIQKKINSICDDFIYHIGSTGLYGGLLSTLATIVDMELKKREADTSAVRILFRSLITSFDEILHIISEKLYDSEEEENAMEVDNQEIDESKIAEDPEMILTNSTPQVQRLLIYLKKFVQDDPKRLMKGLIFVKRRYSAKILCHIIRRFMNSYPDMNIQVDFMTGHNTKIPDSIETILAKKCNDRVLDKFKRDEVNLIVTTSVLEEGIDLQECNLVIAFDRPEHYRQYVQTKGRARMANSEYVIMVPMGSQLQLQQKVKEWGDVNDTLRQYLVVRAVDRMLPNKDDINKIAEREFNEQYKTAGGAVIDHFSAISLLNRYCDILPRDQFTEPVVSLRRTDSKDGIQVHILLPIQSPISDEISGTAMPNLKLAKRSAAFKACVKLYEQKALNENAMPVNSIKCMELQKDVYFKVWSSPEFAKDQKASAGTKKNYRLLELQTPNALFQSMPQPNRELFLYKINIEPNFSTTEVDDNVKVFHNLLQSNRSYGILTMKPIPPLGLMKFYQSFGEINTQIDPNPLKLIINNDRDLEQLKRFNYILFRDVLDVWKEFFVYDLKDSFITVPINGNGIDWDIVKSFQTWSEVRIKPISERDNATYNEKDWLHKVVCKWYSTDFESRYIVTRVANNETPFSQFPNQLYNSYAEYVMEKYPTIGRVVGKDQFLIEVKGITRNLNLMHPGDGEDGRRQRTNRGKEILIPELCHNFNYPGDLWLKAIVLPSALRRVYFLLHAEHIRISINQYVGLDVKNYMPKPLCSKKMPRNTPTLTHARHIQNPIIRPRPEDQIAKELKMSDVRRLNALKLPGTESEEPTDIERNFDQLHGVDLDYYHAYINSKLSVMSLNDENELKPSRYQMAECRGLLDTPSSDEKLCIQLLKTKLSSPVPRGVEQHDILAAITTASAGDLFHMELFEVLGDAFLKFGASLSLMHNHQDWHEGFLSAMKGQIVGNRNLCYNAIKMKLPGMINKNNFDPKDDWQPPMFKVDDVIKNKMRQNNISPNLLFELSLSKKEIESGKVSTQNIQMLEQAFARHVNNEQEGTMQNVLGLQRIADKTNSDCVEAILGACLVSIGVDRTFKVLEMFNILPKRENVDITNLLANQFHNPRVRTNIRDIEIDCFLPNHAELEKNIGYKFKDRAYLLQALTHPTYPTNRVTGCYQQLEFLGDAVLDFLVTSYIYERCPEMDPGKLTDLRSALVNNVTLACICVRYNIHLYILSQNAALTEFISKFVDFQITHNHEVTDHVVLLMEETDVECKMAEYVEVPKTLGDVVEALIGAIFLDSGNNLEVTWRVIYKLMQMELNKFMANVPIPIVRRLYEYPNANPEFDGAIVDNGITFVPLRFTCKGEILKLHGCGKNKDNAKRAASKLALSKLIY